MNGRIVFNETSGFATTHVVVSVRHPITYGIFQNPVFYYCTKCGTDPLLLTVVRSLGVVRADIFVSVPGTTSSRVKKSFKVSPEKCY